MKNAFVRRPAASALPALVLGLTLVLPGFSSAADSSQQGEPLLLAASSGGSLPVIPQAPERNRRVPRRPDDSGASVQGEITQQPAPYASEGAVPPPYSPEPAPVAAPQPYSPAPSAPAAPVPYTPEPYFPESERAAAPAPSPAPAPKPVAAPAPAPPAETTRYALPEPPAQRVRETEPEYSEDRPRRRRGYDPKLVTDPSAATPYVVQEFEVDGPTVVQHGPTPLGVPVSPRLTQPGGVMGTYSYGEPSYPVSLPANPEGAIPQYSTQPMAVSSPTDPGASDLPHGNYPGAVGAHWPSSEAGVYTGVPPERIASPLSPNLESPRPRPDYIRQLPPERVSTPLRMEGPKAPKALRPRR